MVLGEWGSDLKYIKVMMIAFVVLDWRRDNKVRTVYTDSRRDSVS